MEKISKELHGFAVNVLIFKILSENPSYAYQLIKEINKISEGKVKCEEGYLYPLLKKLTTRGYLLAKWKVSGSRQPRKYYELTIKGQVKLRKMLEELTYLQVLEKKEMVA